MTQDQADRLDQLLCILESRSDLVTREVVIRGLTKLLSEHYAEKPIYIPNVVKFERVV